MNFEEQPQKTVISTQQNTDYLYSKLVAVGTDTSTTTPGPIGSDKLRDQVMRTGGLS